MVKYNVKDKLYQINYTMYSSEKMTSSHKNWSDHKNLKAKNLKEAEHKFRMFIFEQWKSPLFKIDSIHKLPKRHNNKVLYIY